MKIKSIITLALMAILGLSSCDSNKSKVEDLTNKFATAVKNNDVATIYDMYPDAKQMENLKLPNGIVMSDIDVVKDEKTGFYIANIKNSRDQKLIFKPTGKEGFEIADSYSLFDIDKQFSDLAVNTGVPMKKLSDLKLNSLLKEDGDFIKFLKKKYGGLTELKLTAFDGVYTRDYSWVDISQNIRNDGNFSVKGTDYDVIFRFNDANGVAASSTKTMAGVDLAPGETFTFTFQLNGYANSAADHALSWKATFNQKGGTSLKDILKKAKLTGTEYAEFEQQTKEDKNGSNNNKKLQL